MCSAIRSNNTSHTGSIGTAEILAASCGRLLAGMDKAVRTRGKGQVG